MSIGHETPKVIV